MLFSESHTTPVNYVNYVNSVELQYIELFGLHRLHELIEHMNVNGLYQVSRCIHLTKS